MILRAATAIVILSFGAWLTIFLIAAFIAWDWFVFSALTHRIIVAIVTVFFVAIAISVEEKRAKKRKKDTTPMTNTEELLALRKGMTPGSWRIGLCYNGHPTGEVNGQIGTEFEDDCIAEWVGWANSKAIAAVPDMLDHIETQAARIAELEAALETLSNDANWWHTSEEPGGPHTAWRGPGEPDEIARAALGVEV